MSFRLIALFAVISLVLVAADSKPSCKIADHINKHRVWKIENPQNVYGNQTVEPSIVKTWPKTWPQPMNTEPEEAINEQINRELFAQYTYISMAAHFGRDDNFLPGFAKFFTEAAEEEHKHAMMFIDYQNKRGGRVKLQPIRQPCRDEWGNGLMAMTEALELEKVLYGCLVDLRNIADYGNDHQMTDFIEANFLGEQIDAIKLLGNYVGTLKRLGDGLGEYQFDKVTLGGGGK